MSRYKVIFFDLDHTLVDTQRQYEIGLARTIETLYNGDVPHNFINRFQHHHANLWGLYDKRLITMLELRRQRFQLAWEDFGVKRTIEEADAFHEVYNQTFDETLVVYPGTIDMLDKLSSGHELGIITNGSPDLQWRKMTATGLHKYISEEALIISENIGKAKPDPTVYQAACDALGVRAGEAVMVGDNYKADYVGAKEFGLDAVWYVPDAGMEGARGQDKALRSPDEVVHTLGKMEQARLV